MAIETSNFRVAAVLSANPILQFLGLRQMVSVSNEREEVHDCFDCRLLDNLKTELYSTSKRRWYDSQDLMGNIGRPKVLLHICY